MFALSRQFRSLSVCAATSSKVMRIAPPVGRSFGYPQTGVSKPYLLQYRAISAFAMGRVQLPSMIAHRYFGRQMSSMPRQNKKSRRGPMVERIRKEAAMRWLPAAKGNLKRQRSGWGHGLSTKTRRQRSRMRKTVYATRSQLRKLKKILPHGYMKTLKI
jgi:ribosomal protein L35